MDMQWPDITDKQCDSAKVEIGRRLADITNAHEELWRNLAELNRNLEYCETPDYADRKLRELEVIEADIGRTDETEAVRYLICALSP